MAIDFAPIKECKNLDTFGIICVKCNQCGRFNDKKNFRKTIEGIYQAEPYCKIHRVKLPFVRIENGVEIYYCPKCRKEYCEFADISPIYWSNYEWLYNDDKVDCQDCGNLDLDDFWCSEEECHIENFIIQCDKFKLRKKEID